METLRQRIEAEAGENTHRRTGYLKEACMDDAKLYQGLWKPEDTLPVIARHWAKSWPGLANLLIKIYLAINGQKEV